MKTFLWFSALILSLNSLVFSQTGWFPINVNSSSQLQSIYFPSNNVGYIAGWSGTVLKSINGGNSWVQQNAGSSAGFMDVFFINENTGWIVGQSGTILRTTNGGSNWINISYPTTHILYQSFFFDIYNGWAVGEDGLMIKTMNGGLNWSEQEIGTSRALFGIKFLDSMTGWITGDYGAIYKTTNGGLNWNSQWFGVYNNLNRMSFISPSTGWISGTNGLVIKTTNGGSSWQLQSTGISNWLTTIFFVSPTVGWAAGSSGAIIKTTNGGNNWCSQQSNTTKDFRSSYFFNELTGYIIGANGAVSKTTDGGATYPTTPQLISPPNNALNQSLTPMLTWNNSGGDYYKIQISTTPNFMVLSDSVTVASTQYTIPPGRLLPAVTYFWRVNAVNIVGTSPWSDVWNFATMVVPSDPVLLFPQNGAVNVPVSPTFIWSAVPSATYFHILILDYEGHFVDSATINNCQYLFPGALSPGSTYYWKVCAGNNNGTGPWSPTFHFITSGTPSTPLLICPLNGAIDVSQTPTLDWNDNGLASSYCVQVSPVSDFAVILDSATVTESQYTVPAGKLQLFYTYFWRVNASNAFGTGPWSEVWRFTVSIIGVKQISSNVPGAFKLYSNYPNPFNPVTKIKFDIPKSSRTQLVVYDVLGRLVETVVNRDMRAGTYEFTWNASKYNSGVYFIRLVSDKNIETKRMMLIK